MVSFTRAGERLNWLCGKDIIIWILEMRFLLNKTF